MIPMSKIKALNHLKGKYFFSRDTMRFFRSRVVSKNATDDGLFITSEQGPLENSPRKYTVRRADLETGDIETVGPFNHYLTLQEAKEALRAAQKETRK